MTSFYQFKNIPVSVSDFHHEVIELWSMVKRAFPDRSFGVITLDHHTDIVAAYRNQYTVNPGEWQCVQSVKQAVSLLKHDEHIDWAIKSGVLEYAKVIAHVNETPAADERITVLHDRNFPDEFTQLNDPEKFYPFAAKILDDSFLMPLLRNIPEGKYILDIDCDNFLCRNALFPENHQLWHKLILNASAITISKESDYVKILRLRGENITGESISDHLLSLIESLLA